MRCSAAMIGLGLSVLATAAAAQDAGPVKAGVDAWQAGDYQSAVGDWQGPAAAGDPDAAFNLGQAYKYGRGVPQDLGRAIQLFGQAAAKGHKQAEANLGLLMFQTGDHAGAIPHLEHAAAAGDPRAQYYLGTALFNGDGLPVDQTRAYALMTLAAASGLPPAANSLRQMDGYLSTSVRQKGTALAHRLQPRQPHASMAQASAAPAPAPQRAAPGVSTGASYGAATANAGPQPITTAQLPPSAAAVPPGAPPPPRPIPASHPSQAAAIAPQAAPATHGTYRVQLGAFGDPDRAKAAWEKVSHRFSLLGGAQPFLVKAGAVTRLQAGPFPSSAAANAACNQAKAAGQDCIALRS